MVTNAGSGFSRCEGLDMTRWREDSTCETWGQYVYVRDLHSGEVWSAGYQPVCRAPDDYEVVFSPDKALFRRRDLEVETTLEITVSPEQLAEVRRITLANHASQHRDLELTSYVEPVLGPHAADLAHPAFGKLFLETEDVPASDALLCRRRPRSLQERVDLGGPRDGRGSFGSGLHPDLRASVRDRPRPVYRPGPDACQSRRPEFRRGPLRDGRAGA